MMPLCSIIHCDSRKNKSHPGVSFHRFPKNEKLKKKWEDAIGTENINQRHKVIWICSLHFDESNFNRTLDVVRLRENTVPSRFFGPRKNKRKARSSVSTEENNVTSSLAHHDAYNSPQTYEKDSSVSNEENDVTSSLIHHGANSNDEVDYDICIHQVPTRSTTEFIPRTSEEETIKHLRRKCSSQRVEIRRLKELVRTQNKKIVNFTNIIKILTKETS